MTRKRPTSEPLLFDEDDLAPVEEQMTALAGTGGWINFSPVVEPGAEPPPRSAVFAAFSSRGDAVPLATWKAAELEGRRATIGIEHGAGPKALRQLAERDLPLPEGWLKATDHPRRGLVVTAPASVEDGEVLWWLLTACHLLSTVPLTGSWTASVYTGETGS